MKTPKQDALSVYMPKVKTQESTRNIVSPMAGKLVSVDVKRGDRVGFRKWLGL